MAEGRRVEAPAAPTLDEVRAFVHLAGELHFGRAAVGLGVARSSLSETIRRLEGKLRVPLFERTSRRVALTPAGARLLPRARGVVAGVAALRSGGAAPPPAAETAGVLRIGLEANGFAELTQPILAMFQLRHPQVVPVLREFNGVAQSFFDAHLDVVLTRSPLLDERLRLTELALEPRGILLRQDHPRVGTREGSIADFLDDSFVALVPPLRDYWIAREHRGGERPRIGGEAFSMQEILYAVGHLGLVTTAGRSIPRSFPFPGLGFAEVEDLSPVVLGVATRVDEARPLVADFVEIAREAVAELAGGAPDISPLPVA